MTTVSEARVGSRRWVVAALLGVSLPLLIWVAQLPPFPQATEYHDFADQRLLLGLPHFWNVVSNLPFAAVGLFGFWWLLRRSGPTSSAFNGGTEWLAYAVFFAGEVLTCFGSGYYHGGPTNETLVWDRLVFSLMLTSFFAIVVTEFVSARVGRLMLGPVVLLGIYSVLYWARTESVGQGDLRLYFAVQFYPLLAMPFLMLLFRSRYTHAWTFALMWVLYAIAKVAEIYDGPIYEWTGLWSGHTVKHVVAAVASYLPLYGLRHRRIRALTSTAQPGDAFVVTPALAGTGPGRFGR